ncbi:MAG: hypothetical protein IPM24_14130 [Bryobacterales bacterium]|nr:hypothetical protein [Bryobacterales bacterium]
MRRKPMAKPEPVVPAALLEEARRSLSTDRLGKSHRCTVCGADSGTPAISDPEETLCWVCRRLKISAWRDLEQQMPVQE